jgi:NADPH-dependent 2,4-dienoyl-CoA reductase/sulfur reductase-like enzyme
MSDTVYVNGQALPVETDTTAAAALGMAGVSATRVSVTGQPRGPLCGMGICFECRATIDGEPQRLTCQTVCTDGMDLAHQPEALARASEKPSLTLRTGERQQHAFDVLVVGGGPAGLRAAFYASEGRRVGIVDDNPALGGQIWRGEPKARDPFAPWAPHVVIKTGARIIAQPQRGQLVAETATGLLSLSYSKLILATGARELFLPFPGWTLPNVMGAGGLQALVKGGLPIAGKRVIVAGSGPLLLAVAAYLKKRGAVVPFLIEQAPWDRVRRFGLGMWRYGKLWQAISLRWKLRGVRFLYGHWIAAADGDDKVRAVTLTDGQKSWQEPCDYLACGYGLVPNVELAAHLGCAIDAGGVRVNEWQETTIPDIYCVGETTGIGGLDKSLVEGKIAGRAAVGKNYADYLAKRDKARRFAQALEQTYALRDELKTLANADTMVCRCEDVTLGQLQACGDWRAAKLQTRCGMGPCQGRVCGAALRFLSGWQVESVRPPVFPARVESLV